MLGVYFCYIATEKYEVRFIIIMALWSLTSTHREETIPGISDIMVEMCALLLLLFHRCSEGPIWKNDSTINKRGQGPSSGKKLIIAIRINLQD